MKLGLTSVVFGVSYTFLVGFLEFPQGLGAAFFWIIAILWLIDELRRLQVKLPFHILVLIVSVILSALSFICTTNQLVIVLCAANIFVVVLLLIIARATGQAPPSTALSLLKMSGRLFLGFIQECFNPKDLRGLFESLQIIEARPVLDPEKLPVEQFQTVRAHAARPKVKSALRRGLAIGLLPLILFHLLFTQINTEYANFMQALLDLVFAWEFWKIVFQATVQSWLLYALLSVGLEESKDFEVKRVREWLYALIPSIILFLIFSGFHGQYLGMDLASLPFKDLSLYVQQGFWQLVAVAIFGYLFWIKVAVNGEDLSSSVTTKRLLAIFAVELILISIFVIHKVGLHQVIFGLKDTRIAATLGALVALATFVAATGVSLRKGEIRMQGIFSLQLVLTSTFITGMALINLDRFVTRTYPINYRSQGQHHPDLAYLLMNSYDNYQEWGSLMMDAIEHGIPEVEDYYWGAYTPLCHMSSYRAPDGSIKTMTYNYFLRSMQRLSQASKRSSQIIERLRTVGRYNYRLESARDWVAGNQNLIESFSTLVERNCQS